MRSHARRARAAPRSRGRERRLRRGDLDDRHGAVAALLEVVGGGAVVHDVGARVVLGRLDDLGADGMGLIEEICTIYNNYDMQTEVLVASARSTQHVVDAALLGADVVTIPPKILGALYKHPLTDKGLDAFMADWKQTGQSIL